MYKLKEILKVLAIGLLVYYFIPFFAYGFSQSIANVYATICVLIINSLYAIFAGMILMKKIGFKWYCSFLVAILYIPSAFLYFNAGNYIYAILYVIMYLVGTLIEANIIVKKKLN